MSLSRNSSGQQPRRGFSRDTLVTLGISLAIVIVAVIGAVFLLSRVLEAVNPSVPEQLNLPTATNPADATASAIALLPPTDLPTHTPNIGTLPPTWTPTGTLPPTASATITVTPGARIQNQPTLDAAQLANTYWDGDGTSYDMWSAQMPDGSYPRFERLPVNLYVQQFGNIVISSNHERAIQNALNEIGQVVPIVRVDNRVYAHITLWMMTVDEFEQFAECDFIDTTAGCTQTTYTDAGIRLVTVWLRVTDQCFDEDLLHELTHALGVTAHSPEPQDVMYANQTCNPAQYSTRDVNTLRALYDAPAYRPN